MPSLRPLTTLSALILSSALASLASAGDSHDHDHAPRAHAAHVHGVAEMTLVEDAGTVTLELNAPGMSLAGFEHAPKTDADVARIDAVLTTLRTVDRVVSIDGGHCKLISHDAKSSYPDKPAHDHGHDHDDDHEHKSDTHNAFSASYQFHCAKPDTITGLQLPLLKTFPSLEELSVQWIIGGKQGAQKAASSQTSLKF